MNMKLKALLLGLGFLFMTSGVFAQFTLSAELRSRGEMRNGYRFMPTEATDPAFFVGQRTRLNLDYENEKFRIGVKFQDVRTWGDADIYKGHGQFGSTASLDLYEGWAELLFDNSSLKIGRQEIIYDDARIFSNRNWNNLGLTYDAAVFKYGSNDDVMLDIGGVWNNNSENFFGDDLGDHTGKIKGMGFLYFKKNLGSTSLSLLEVTSLKQKAETSNIFYPMHTLGANLEMKSNLILALRGYYQLGQNSAGTDVSAYFFNAEVGTKVGSGNITVGLDYLSGNDADNDDTDYLEKSHTFDLLYGARFKFYGYLNHFIVPSDMKGGGLMDIHLKTKFPIDQKNIITANYHFFSLATNVANPDPDTDFYDKGLGSEIDLTYLRKFGKGASMKLGYSFAMPSDTWKEFKGIDLNDDTSEMPSWFWVMFTFKPTFLKSGE